MGNYLVFIETVKKRRTYEKFYHFFKAKDDKDAKIKAEKIIRDYQIELRHEKGSNKYFVLMEDLYRVEKIN